jgi:hypothetical protein
MRGISLFCFFVFASARLLAQSAFAPEQQIPPHLEPQNLIERQFIMTEASLPELLTKAFQRYQGLRTASCDRNASADYALSLTIKGDYKACTDYALRCIRRRPSRDTNMLPALIIQGARCAALDYDYAQAYSIFHKGLKSGSLKNPDNQAYYLEFAMLARYSLYPQWTEQILALNPHWDAGQKKLALGFVELAGNTAPSLVSKEQVFQFVDSQLETATGYYEQYLKSWRITLYSSDYQIEKAYQYLNSDAATLENPLDWYNTAFTVIYKVNSDDFKTANRFYGALLPFAHSRSPFPKETNVYNYSEMRNSVCKNTMLQGERLNELNQHLTKWKNGSESLNQILTWMRSAPQENFTKSDFLATYGGLLTISGNAQLAEIYYWRAHQYCPWNNRAHWGQVLLQRQKKYRAFPEFKANEALVDETLKKISFPADTAKYFSNWKSLPLKSQNRVKFAARIWAPYLPALLASGSQSYIKPPFELLHLSPGMGVLKDQRITYPFDHRLWDDVRGAGGLSVAADHDEVFQTVQGDYNLLGHEMAHQFHAFLAMHAPTLNSCIQKLYDEAKKRNVFPDGYAKSNVKEYFAQGVTYYLVPATAPARYGINASWLPKHDPKLYEFIKSIEQAQGDHRKISCPRTAE